MEHEMRVIRSKAIPKDTFYLMPEPTFFGYDVGPLIWRRDPWPEPPYPLDPSYVDERNRGLSFLADLLDGLCEDFGMDPEKAWREPKYWEQQVRWDQYRYVAHERIALSVIPPNSVMKVVIP